MAICISPCPRSRGAADLPFTDTYHSLSAQNSPFSRLTERGVSTERRHPNAREALSQNATPHPRAVLTRSRSSAHGGGSHWPLLPVARMARRMLLSSRLRTTQASHEGKSNESNSVRRNSPHVPRPRGGSENHPGLTPGEVRAPARATHWSWPHRGGLRWWCRHRGSARSRNAWLD